MLSPCPQHLRLQVSVLFKEVSVRARVLTASFGSWACADSKVARLYVMSTSEQGISKCAAGAQHEPNNRVACTCVQAMTHIVDTAHGNIQVC